MKLCLRCNQYFDDPIENCPSDGAILENVGKDPLIGVLINDRYLVDSVIGKGSSGIVYKASRLGRGQKMVVAIKVLHSYIGAAGVALDRFLREAQAASQLRNPHIITIWDSGVTEDGQPYFVMDYLEGTTLGRLIKEKGRLEPKRVLSLLHQICEALTEAHRQGIVHRDLKPENIILQESDHGHDYVKLLDFGIADSPQHTQSTFKLEKPRTVSGSPAYMSPEQCQGLELDGRSDIYSLAIVVFEMLTGCRPFSQNNDVNVMVLHVSEPPMTLSSARPDLIFPPEVEDVISGALSKQPSERQANVQDFLSEFESAWQDEKNQSLQTVKERTNISNPELTKINKEEAARAITSDELVVNKDDSLLRLSSEQTAHRAKPTEALNETPIQQSIKEQSTTRNKTIERLIEAAKRGNSLTGIEAFSDATNQSQAQQQTNIGSPHQNQANQDQMGMAVSYANKKAARPSYSSLISADASSTSPSPASAFPGSASASPGSASAFPSSASAFPGSVSASPNLAGPNPPTAPVPTAGTVESYTKEEPEDNQVSLGENNEMYLSVFQRVKAGDEPEFHVKQRHVNTLSRLAGFKRGRRADTSVVSTKARAAALKAESQHAPINLWHLAGTITVSACLLACVYITYTGLVSLSSQPVAYLDTLLNTGNYERVVDILEGKRLSEPLNKLENNQLNAAYLNIAKKSFSKNDLDQASSFVVKIDSNSSSAEEADILKREIVQAKKVAPKLEKQ